MQKVLPVRRRGGRELPGMRDGGAHDSAGRAADLAVARVEARGGAVVEVRQHDLDSERRPREPRRRDREPGPPPVPCERVPEPVARDDECDLLLAERRRGGGEREGHEAVLVEVPEGVEQQRRRERDRVKLVQGQPLDGREEQVDQREPERGALRAEVLAAEPEHRQRTERDGDGLAREQQVGARPDPPERREHDEDRVDVGAEPRDLLALQARDLEQVAVRSRPHCLHHVAQVEAGGLEGAVAQDRERSEARRIGGDRRPEQAAGRHRTLSRIVRQRAPRTASLARSR